MQTTYKNHGSPSKFGWALLLLALATAVFLRVYNLSSWPPGLYRDEAFNGLDALRVLDGEFALFFTANNGREPLYITLTALSIALFGRTVLAVRLVAAVVGSLTTWLVYKLGRSWFGWRVGLLVAWLWAITLWPIHLSRVGLRTILLPAVLALTFWLGTEAYRRQNARWWLVAGAAYGLGFYTYLAIRFTPLLLLALGAFLLWQGQRGWLRRGAGWFLLGTAVTLLPLALFYLQNPDWLLGRTGQVSIFNSAINDGDLWGTLWRQIWQSLGLFFWQGDTILRHNPAGRPLFDWLMIIPFLLGLGWCFKNWRKPAATAVLLWSSIMLGVTILAEDAPHFLRAVGILPGAIFLPALGLAWLWRWPRLPQAMRGGLVALLMGGSLLLTMRDYVNYNQQPDTALLFEAAAVELAERLNAEDEGTAVYLDRWFWDELSQKGWPSIPFLADLEGVTLYRPENGLPPTAPGQAVSLYTWPFGDLEFVPDLLSDAEMVVVQNGRLARGDLEPEPYPLYVRYTTGERPTNTQAVQFGNAFQLQNWTVTLLDEQTVQVDLIWQKTGNELPNQITFLHLLSSEGLVTQADAPPGGAYWFPHWWRKGQWVQERRLLILTEPYNPALHTIQVGLYDPVTLDRLLVVGADGDLQKDSWQLAP
ncbi:ArnT family glycosyltransferase [Candidatus Leptofilum sp.]|uniref:ArnT family glycosyltransferase n=1 Tax=Candidatus Leptofilum sp. TaxID=3241576 RepID=UPI003B5BDB5F